MERSRELTSVGIGSIFGALAPISNILEACMIIFIVDLLAGVAAGIFVQKEKFDIKKAFVCILEAAVITTLIAMILVIGDKIDNHEGALSAISVVVYALIYFYGTNTLKNLTRLFPRNSLLRFLYYVLSFEIVEKIPYLANYKKSLQNDTDTQPAENSEK